MRHPRCSAMSPRRLLLRNHDALQFRLSIFHFSFSSRPISFLMHVDSTIARVRYDWVRLHPGSSHATFTRTAMNTAFNRGRLEQSFLLLSLLYNHIRSPRILHTDRVTRTRLHSPSDPAKQNPHPQNILDNYKNCKRSHTIGFFL